MAAAPNLAAPFAVEGGGVAAVMVAVEVAMVVAMVAVADPEGMGAA